MNQRVPTISFNTLGKAAVRIRRIVAPVLRIQPVARRGGQVQGATKDRISHPEVQQGLSALILGRLGWLRRRGQRIEGAPIHGRQAWSNRCEPQRTQPGMRIVQYRVHGEHQRSVGPLPVQFVGCLEQFLPSYRWIGCQQLSEAVEIRVEVGRLCRAKGDASLDASRKQGRIRVSEGHRRLTATFKLGESVQQERTHGISHGVKLQLPREPGGGLPAIGKDERFPALERRFDIRSWGLFQELRRDELLERFVPLGDVVHDVGATRSTTRAAGKFAGGSFLLRRREPDFAGSLAA